VRRRESRSTGWDRARLTDEVSERMDETEGGHTPAALARAEGAVEAPLTILHVITTLDVGGAERILVSLTTGSPRERLDHHVVSLVPGSAGIRVTEIRLGPRPPRPLALVSLARLIHRARPRIVQGWLYHGDLAATVGLALAGRRRATRLAWGLQCSNLNIRLYPRQLALTIRACVALSARPDVVVSNSGAGLAGHRALGYRPVRTCVIHPGVDTERFRPRPEIGRAVRHELGIPPGAPVLAHVARRDPMKDHACILAVLDRLPAVHALAIGAGTETLPDRPGLHRLGRRTDVERLLAACDVSVSSSAFGEGFSNSIAESMAAGVPVVATDVGDARLAVGDVGHVVPARAPDRLAEAVRQLLDEPPPARRARGERCRARIIAQFSLRRMVEQYTDLYLALAGAGWPSGHPSESPTRP
jgi:glycosyltransferase involved in cell wall biosynthesis